MGIICLLIQKKCFPIKCPPSGLVMALIGYQFNKMMLSNIGSSPHYSPIFTV